MSDTQHRPGPRTSRADYALAVAALRLEFPWINDAVLGPAPGHIDLLRRFLRAFESVTRTATQEGATATFLRVETDHEGMASMLYFEFSGDDLVGRQEAAVRDHVQRFIRVAGDTCAICGTARALERSHACEVHERAKSGDWIIFSDEEPRAAPNVAKAPGPNGEVAVTAGQGPPPTPEAPTAPLVQLYAETDVDALEASADHQDAEARARIKLAVRKLRVRPPDRPLATVPLAVEAFIAALGNEFPNFGDFIDYLAKQFAPTSPRFQ